MPQKMAGMPSRIKSHLHPARPPTPFINEMAYAERVNV
jgi:hypothetical protein